MDAAQFEQMCTPDLAWGPVDELQRFSEEGPGLAQWC